MHPASFTKLPSLTQFLNVSKLILLLSAGCLALGSCGGSSSSGSSGGTTQPLEISGNWTATAVNSDGATGGLSLAMVPSSCDVTLPNQYNLVVPPPYTTCFIADTDGEGSLSYTGAFLYPPEAVLIGVQADPVPANGSEQLSGVLLENSGLFPIFFDLTGIIQASTSSISGNFACDQNSISCAGLSGTLSGTHQ